MPALLRNLIFFSYN